MNQHTLQTLHQEVLEDFKGKRINEEERDKRFIILYKKASLFGLKYVIEERLKTNLEKETHEDYSEKVDWEARLRDKLATLESNYGTRVVYKIPSALIPRVVAGPEQNNTPKLEPDTPIEPATIESATPSPPPIVSPVYEPEWNDWHEWDQ